ncbi:hypothetical protein JOQ06_022989, partial [Pogonophryne albipinna]
MLSLHNSAFSLMLFAILSGVSCEDLTPVKTEEFSPEGSYVTLSYKAGSNANYYFWYRQYPGEPPEFLISHSASGAVGTNPIPGLNITVESNRINMIISSAAVTDSAVYYCALRPTVTGNTNTLYKNLWSKDNTTLHNIHQREPLSGSAGKISLHQSKK